MTAMPVALCGKNPQTASRFTDLMGPEYEVVHVFTSTAAAKQELPTLLRGVNIKPESGIGSNVTSSQTKKPRAIVCGGGFSREELEQMRATEDAQNIPWLYPDREQERGPGFIESLVERAKTSMRKHGLVERKEDSVTPDLWGW